MTGAQTNHELAVDSIYTALVQLMEKKPYKEITITDITKRAGVSRMAYYRNYETKDEILTKRLEGEIHNLSERSKRKKYTSMEDALVDFFDTFQADGILQTVVRAGLVDKLIDYHKSLMIELYKNILDVDISIPENMMRLFADMGSSVWMILYCKEQDFKVDSKIIAQMLTNH